MNLLIAQTIVDALTESGKDVTLCENYSGRGMYGKTTTGVVTECGLPKMLLLLMAWVAEMSDDERDAIIASFDDIGYVIDASSDSMGRSDIIIY